MEGSMNIAEFTEYLFDRSANGTEWYFSNEHEDPSVAKDLLVRLAAETFRGIAKTSSQFDERQVCMGLQYLVNPSCGPIPYLYLDTSIDFSLRRDAIIGMETVFRDVFSHLNVGRTLYQNGKNAPLSYRETCYMWWDLFPRHGAPRKPDLEQTDTVICQTICSILKIDNLACQESALHGLGHWFSSRPDEVVEAVETFLPRTPVELRQYAIDAMQGRVQ